MIQTVLYLLCLPERQFYCHLKSENKKKKQLQEPMTGSPQLYKFPDYRARKEVKSSCQISLQVIICVFRNSEKEALINVVLVMFWSMCRY